ncbi:MAG TPA: phosphatidylglycerophosphatase A [Cytophagales bacterium]
MDKLLATGLGIGYLPKGGGTVASAACCLGLYGLHAAGGRLPAGAALLVAAGLFGLGLVAAGRVERYWGKDNYRVVIDEVAGMWIALLGVPVTTPRLLAGLVLFRLFDIYKPFFIRRAEQLPSGLGVMLDDVLAGLCANMVLQVLVKFFLL